MNLPARVVPRFEARLLRILEFFLRRVPREQALPLFVERGAAPRCLSRACVELVQDRLAKGCVHLLARGGGWRRERHLRGERVAAGRLWERTPPGELALEFSGQALRFLVWITAGRPGDPKGLWDPPLAELTVADQLLCFLAFTALQPTDELKALKKLAAFSQNTLCRLACPEEFTGRNAGAILPDFGPWIGGLGGCILEAVQPELASRWEKVERGKGEVRAWHRLQRLGTAQETVLARFLGALETAGRPDLARFLLQAAAALLTEGATPELWVGALQWTGPRLAERAETYRAALAFVRAVEGLRRWERQARGVGFLDEGYAAAQLWKAEWERWDGETLAERAAALVRRLDPMNLSSEGVSS